MQITQSMQENVVKVLGLTDLPQHELESVFSELGAVVVESALLQFLAAHGEWEQESFESWVTEHANEEDILEQLVTAYPLFGKILTEELLQFKEKIATAVI